MAITKVAEAKNSNNIWKVGFIKRLKFFRTNVVTVYQITTDRHLQIRKHMRENEKDSIHQFDNGWIKSIINHLRKVLSTCNGR